MFDHDIICTIKLSASKNYIIFNLNLNAREHDIRARISSFVKINDTFLYYIKGAVAMWSERCTKGSELTFYSFQYFSANFFN